MTILKYSSSPHSSRSTTSCFTNNSFFPINNLLSSQSLSIDLSPSSALRDSHSASRCIKSPPPSLSVHFFSPFSYPNGSVWKGSISRSKDTSKFALVGSPRLVTADPGIGSSVGPLTNHEFELLAYPELVNPLLLQLDLNHCSSKHTFHQSSRRGSLIMNPHQKNKVDISVSGNPSLLGQCERDSWALLIVRTVSQ